MILGSGFSAAFGDVILMTDAVIILLVLITLFPDRIAALVHRVAAILTCLITHIGLPHR